MEIKGSTHLNETFSGLYKTYLPKIRRYILSNSGTEDDALDIFQEALLILYKQMLIGKTSLEGNHGNFLFIIAKNLYINHVHKHHHRYVNVAIPDIADESLDFTEQWHQEDRWAFVNRLLSEYDEESRQFLLLSISKELNMKEIAQRMGLANENVAKAKAYRFRKQLLSLAKSRGREYEQLKF